MNYEQLEALKTIVKVARFQAQKLSKKKTMSKDEVWNCAVLYREIATIESWMENQIF